MFWNGEHDFSATCLSCIGILEGHQSFTGRETTIRCSGRVTSFTSIISMLRSWVLETRYACRRLGQGLTSAITQNRDWYFRQTARTNNTMSATLLKQHFQRATGTTVSIQTVRTRLHPVGLYARRPIFCVLFISVQRTALRWAQEHLRWGWYAWSNLLFLDKIRFRVQPKNSCYGSVY